MSGDECEGALERLYEYLDGELPADVFAEVEEHLDDCAPCGHERDVNRKLIEVISRCPKEAAPEDLREKVLSIIATTRTPESSSEA